MAYPLIALELTDSAALAGAVAGCSLVAFVVCGPLVSPWISRRQSLRRVLLSVDIGSFLVLTTFTTLVYFDKISIYIVLLVSLLQGLANAIYLPARTLAIRDAVPREARGQAFAQDEIRTHLAGLLGPAIGGAAYAAGRAVPFLSDGLGRLISAVLLSMTPLPRSSPPAHTRVNEPEKQGLVAVVRSMTREPMARILLLTAPLFNIALGATPLLTVLLGQRLGASPTDTGLLLAALGVGGLLGSFVAPYLSRALSVARLLLLCSAFWSVLVLAMSLSSNVLVLGFFFGAVNFMSPTLNVVAIQGLLTSVPEPSHGPAMSALGSLSAGATPLGPLLVGVLADSSGPVTAGFSIAAYLVVMTAVIAVMVSRWRLQQRRGA